MKSYRHFINKFIRPDIFCGRARHFGGSSSESSSGYSQLPPLMQEQASTAANNLSQSSTAGQSLIDSITSGTYSDASTQYYNDVVSGKYTDLGNNAEYQNMMDSLTQQYGEGLTNTLNTANSSAQKAGNFLSSYSGDYNTKLTDTLATDWLNQIADTSLSAYTTERGYQDAASTNLANYLSSLATTGNIGTTDLISLLSAMAGTSSVSGSWQVL